ncbi:MAG: VanZ family protein [candidate division Zixibacteria bacterium]|nr:VanZ family protein [candidate division Zixibacteria bacterium]
MNKDHSKRPWFKSSFIYYHLPVIIYGSIIIIISSIPRLKPPDLKFYAADKLAHFVEYGIFSYLTFRSFVNIKPNMDLTMVWAISLIFLISFGLLDEYYQSFIPGRFSDLGDWLTDSLSAVLIVTFLWVRRRRLKEATK